MLHKMKTGGLKMLKKGPNFKNFPKTPSLRKLGPPGLVAVSSRNSFSLAENIPF